MMQPPEAECSRQEGAEIEAGAAGMGFEPGNFCPLAVTASRCQGAVWSLQMHSRCTAKEFSRLFLEPAMMLKSLIYKDWCLRQDSNLH